MEKEYLKVVKQYQKMEKENETMQVDSQMTQSVDLEDGAQKAFEYVRKTYFPRWDCKGEWRVVLDEDIYIGGEPFTAEDKTIVVSVDLLDYPAHLRTFLVDAIAHEIAGFGAGHKNRWYNRMCKARGIALDIGDDLLAYDISRHLEGYEFLSEVERKNLYHEIRMTVQNKTELDFESCMCFIARNFYAFGVYAAETLAIVKLCRKVYDEAKADLERQTNTTSLQTAQPCEE